MMVRPRITFSIGIDNAEIMLRMLGVIFRGDAISGRLGVARQRQIFFKQLVGIPATPDLRPIAAEGSVFRGHRRPSVAVAKVSWTRWWFHLDLALLLDFRLSPDLRHPIICQPTRRPSSIAVGGWRA